MTKLYFEQVCLKVEFMCPEENEQNFQSILDFKAHAWYYFYVLTFSCIKIQNT